MMACQTCCLQRAAMHPEPAAGCFDMPAQVTLGTAATEHVFQQPTHGIQLQLIHATGRRCGAALQVLASLLPSPVTAETHWILLALSWSRGWPRALQRVSWHTSAILSRPLDSLSIPHSSSHCILVTH